MVLLITGLHTIIFSNDAEADRAFFGETLGLRSVDAGDGWLIFAMPPTELAVHPGNDRHELYLMCDDIDATLAELQRNGIEVEDVNDTGWGKVSVIKLPSGAPLAIYEPLHASPPRDR